TVLCQRDGTTGMGRRLGADVVPLRVDVGNKRRHVLRYAKSMANFVDGGRKKVIKPVWHIASVLGRCIKKPGIIAAKADRRNPRLKVSRIETKLKVSGDRVSHFVEKSKRVTQHDAIEPNAFQLLRASYKKDNVVHLRFEFHIEGLLVGGIFGIEDKKEITDRTSRKVVCQTPCPDLRRIF